MKGLTQAETSVHFQTDIITSFSVTFGTFFVMKSLQAATSNERHDFRLLYLLVNHSLHSRLQTLN